MRIILFGFSGSGKSSIADLVAKEYGLRVIHPSSILQDLYAGKKIDINNTRPGKGFWESEKGVELFKNRLNEDEPLDVLSDKILLKEAAKGNVVIDSWSLPWLTDIGTKIYLKASRDIRAARVAKRSNISYAKAFQVVKMKDKETRKLFKRIYGFDIKKDTSVFNLIIDTNNINENKVFKEVKDYLSL